MTKERRTYPRLKVIRFIAGLQTVGKGEFEKIEIVDISAGGLCFLQTFPVSVGENVLFSFTFRKCSMQMPGKVIRVDGREIGVKFTDSEDEIMKFVRLFNREVSGMLITKKGTSRIMVPGEYDESMGFDDLNQLLDPDKDE
ncbi:MAG TPA: PilZ domain-containing protein [Spirochaetota bacterium]|nr:PilZ domain-containing protein [Spirochaetota bacterium]